MSIKKKDHKSIPKAIAEALDEALPPALPNEAQALGESTDATAQTKPPHSAENAGSHSTQGGHSKGRGLKAYLPPSIQTLSLPSLQSSPPCGPTSCAPQFCGPIAPPR